MRWVPFLIFAYLIVLLQTSAGRVLTIHSFSCGPFGPDWVVIFAVFLALTSRTTIDAMLAGWVLGMLLDLTTGGIAGVTRVGPMAILFTLAVWLVFSVREALFRDRLVPQILLGFLFCLATHGLWMTVQVLLAPGTVLLEVYGRLWLQVICSAGYTAVFMPLGYFLLSLCRPLLLSAPPSMGRNRRSRGG